MTIAIIALTIGFVGVAVYARSLEKRIESILTRMAKTANNEASFRGELKKEMSKLHSYCDETRKMSNALKSEIVTVKKKQKEFEDLADESVRAQIESEKAWAEGVRAIAGFGAEIPTLNTKGLNNE